MNIWKKNMWDRCAAIYKEIGEGTELMYSILTDKTNHITVNIEGTKRSSALPEQAPVYNGIKPQSLTSSGSTGFGSAFEPEL